MFKILCCILVFMVDILALSFAAENSQWGYSNVKEEYQPQNWHKLEGYSTCGLKRQSPIHIYSKDLEQKDLGTLTFNGYDTLPSGTIKVENNGHTLSYDGPALSGMSVSGGGLPEGNFKLIGFHMHWGSENNKGSEHWIDGDHYAAELHLVHLNPNYADADAAKLEPDGLVVIGVMVKIGGDGATFAPLMPSIEGAPYYGSTFDLMAFKLENLLPKDRTRFVRYNGSLTTPGCDEAVIWTVMADPVEMSQDQIEEFRSGLHHTSEDKVNMTSDYLLVDNHRPTQELNGRTVYSSYKPIIPTDPPINATGTMATNMAVVFGALLLLAIMK